jgi:hypothetical protein
MQKESNENIFKLKTRRGRVVNRTGPLYRSHGNLADAYTTNEEAVHDGE